MPGVRGVGQKPIIVYMSEELIAEIDKRLAGLGFNDRASLIREAVYDKLVKNGSMVLRESATAPSRAGKGGRPAKYHVKAKAKKQKKI